MQKKNGIDEYGIFLIWAAIVLVVVAYFVKSTFLNVLSSVFIFYALFRSMSSNVIKRSQENQVFVKNFIDPLKGIFKKGKKDTSAYKYISCPSCGQKLRIPKNKGKIKVRCPKCKDKFDAKS